MNFLQYRFLCYRYDEDTFTLLGYPLSLSPTESRILLSILENDASEEDSPPTTTGHACVPAPVAVHVCAINRKAARISGRKLLKFQNGTYHVSSRM